MKKSYQFILLLMIYLLQIMTSEYGLRRYKELKGSGVPLILIGEKRINGYSEQTLRKTLGMSSD